jgi:hypothetical protein
MSIPRNLSQLAENYDPTSGTLTNVVNSSSNGITINATSIATSYSIPSSYNGLSAGPVSVATGVTVTVQSGSTWVVV